MVYRYTITKYIEGGMRFAARSSKAAEASTSRPTNEERE